MKKIVLLTVFTVSCMLCGCANKATQNVEATDSVKVDSITESTNDSILIDSIVTDSVE